MPRLEFGSWENFKTWLTIQVRKYGRLYKLYLTDNQEVVAVPVTSTRPLEYGYYIFEDEPDENVKKQGILRLIEGLSKELKLDLFRVKEVVWNPEREPRTSTESD